MRRRKRVNRVEGFLLQLKQVLCCVTMSLPQFWAAAPLSWLCSSATNNLAGDDVIHYYFKKKLKCMCNLYLDSQLGFRVHPTVQTWPIKKHLAITALI